MGNQVLPDSSRKGSLPNGQVVGTLERQLAEWESLVRHNRGQL